MTRLSKVIRFSLILSAMFLLGCTSDPWTGTVIRVMAAKCAFGDPCSKLAVRKDSTKEVVFLNGPALVRVGDKIRVAYWWEGNRPYISGVLGEKP